jgi:hypothetical protein
MAGVRSRVHAATPSRIERKRASDELLHRCVCAFRDGSQRLERLPACDGGAAHECEAHERTPSVSIIAAQRKALR